MSTNRRSLEPDEETLQPLQNLLPLGYQVMLFEKGKTTELRIIVPVDLPRRPRKSTKAQKRGGRDT
jgi:hypothetical protein